MSTITTCLCGHGTEHHNRTGCWYGASSTSDGCECRVPVADRQETQ